MLKNDVRASAVGVGLARAVIVALLLLAPAVSRAQATPPGPTPPSPPPELVSHKSPPLAGGLAVVTTVVGWGLVAAGVADDSAGAVLVGVPLAAIGPSVGHVYAGEYRHALITTSLRVAGLALAYYGVASSTLCFGDSCPDGAGHSNAGLSLLGVGIAAGVGLYDWIDAPSAARRANRRADAALRSVFVSPTVGAQGRVGLSLSGTF